MSADGFPITRHCAFCLIPLSGQNIRRCGKCKRRTYCSQACQKLDWSLKKGDGQGHRNWCGLECGEEGIDFEVAPIPGKGLGLIAKRPIPIQYRILVEGPCSEDHPALQDLMPLNGTLNEKIHLNGLGCGPEDSVDSVLCLRLARANHSCAPDAAHTYDETMKVLRIFNCIGANFKVAAN
jgi:hypothetical protein